MKTLVARRHKHMSNGASNDGTDDSQYNCPEDGEMSMHDRLGDDARDQPNESASSSINYFLFAARG